MIRKHSAKVITIVDKTGEKNHYVLIGGRWYYNGGSRTGVKTKSKDGFWDDENIKSFLCNPNYTLCDLAKIYKGCKAQVYIREWTTNQAVYGVPF